MNFSSEINVQILTKSHVFNIISRIPNQILLTNKMKNSQSYFIGRVNLTILFHTRTIQVLFPFLISIQILNCTLISHIHMYFQISD